MSDGKEPYGLDPTFERQVGLLCATSKKFYNTVGHALDPESLADSTTILIAKVAKQIFKETGKGPGSASVLMQRLRRLEQAGKVSLARIDDVLDLMIETDELDAADAIEELAPVIQRHTYAQVVQESMAEYGRHGDFESIKKKIEYASSIGKIDESVGMRVGGSEAFAEINRVRRVQRMPTGVPELDATLRGGLPRGTATMYIAGSGGGKSMMMSHQAAVNWSYGMFVGYASLELPDFEIAARCMANLTGVPTSVISGGDFKEAKKKIRRLFPTLGTLLIQKFSPKHTSVNDIIRWVEKCEESEGYPMDLVILDYIDKMKNSNKNSRDNEYVTQGQQAEEFRVYIEENRKWGLTASQAKTKGRDSRKRIGIDDVRDSSRKVDVMDAVITLTKDASGEMIEYFVGKNRFGSADIAVGPFPHDWERGRMVVMEDP